MQHIADRLADISQRISECEQRIATLRQHLVNGPSRDTVQTALLLYTATSTLQELRAHQSQLKDLPPAVAARKRA